MDAEKYVVTDCMVPQGFSLPISKFWESGKSVLGELCNLVFETSEEDSTHVSEACPLLITLHRLPAILQYTYLLTSAAPAGWDLGQAEALQDTGERPKRGRRRTG